ncbi:MULTISPECIES: group 1 truncated hemoglobin [Hydrotalea]|uniref:group 1 truncated hemoglobin n=1 Tax=Hydrotalea TaxID=1004300 RepID=UPI0010271D7D|nr:MULTISPECIES: group 1 truncated hemoglobin [Hydrotalea]RWZ90655.1 MAG: group 1 truncated hemoglobin [Hydrotalea sp. AMD]
MKKVQTVFLVTAFFAAIALLGSSCKKSDTTPPMMTKTLYDSLGGTTMVPDPAVQGAMIEKGRLGIRSVVDSAIFVIAADTNINVYFKVLLQEVSSGNLSGFKALSKNLTDFFCVGTGAKNFTYGGKDMVSAHNPATNPRMNGKAMNDDFDSFIKDVVVAAKKNGLPDYLIARLGTIINSLRSQVVQA